MSTLKHNLRGQQKQNLNHFASIVKMAMADGVITEEEEKLLKKVAKKLHILEDVEQEVLKNYKEYPITTPHNYEDRIELLYDYTKMIYADGSVSAKEASVLRKVCVGLNFPLDNVEKVADEAIHLVLNDNSLEEFTKAIKYVNRI